MPLSSRALTVLALIAASAAVLEAQSRRSLASGDPEAQLLSYYATVMEFAPVAPAGLGGRWLVGGALAYIPSLPLEDRTVGFGGTKPEDTNRCPAFPRVVAATSVGRLGIEAGWTPPLKVCGVKADIGAVALSYRFDGWPGGDLTATVRAASVFGTLDAAFTCSADATRNSEDLTCYGGSESSDRVAPLTLSAEAVLAYSGWRARRLEPYAMMGLTRQRVNFDVHYSRSAAQAAAVGLPVLADSERIGASLSRYHAALGATWSGLGPVRLGAELFYSPGAVLTLRGRATVALGRSDAR